jgi:hypothetical protein
VQDIIGTVLTLASSQVSLNGLATIRYINKGEHGERCEHANMMAAHHVWPI